MELKFSVIFDILIIFNLTYDKNIKSEVHDMKFVFFSQFG